MNDVSDPEGLVLGADGSWPFQVLRSVLSVARDLVNDSSAWVGWRVEQHDGAFGYARVELADDLCFGSQSGPRRVRLAIHEFAGDSGSASELHNHRFPLVVLPLAVDADPSPLYEMVVARQTHLSRQPAEPAVARSAGVYWILPGVPYAINDPLGVYHSVRSLRPHLSLVIADVSAQPLRGERMSCEPLADHEVSRILRAAGPGLRFDGDSAPYPKLARMRRKPTDERRGVLVD